jgi:uncharacterized protein
MKTTKEENIEIAQTGINEFINGNIDGLLEVCAEDITWSTHQNPDVPFAKTYMGKTGAKQFLNELADNVDFSVFSPEKYYSDEDMVFVKTHQVAKVKSTGKSYDHHMLMTFKIKHGKVSDFFAYVDSADQGKAFAK